MAFCELLIEGNLIGHSQVSWEIGDQVFLDDALDRNRTVEASETDEVDIGATVLIKHCEGLTRSNRRDTGVSVDGQKTLILFIVSEMGNVIDDDEKGVVILCGVVDQIELFEDFRMIDV
jgi:hypothetical protein